MELKAAAGLATRIQTLYTTCWQKLELFPARPAAWPVLIGALVFAVHLSLLPLILRTWRTTGDEPHYLLAAHSLVKDWDFDLANNYDQLDYLAFYFSQDIVRQVRLNEAGQQILDHHPGLSVLIAPAYAVGGRPGVLLFQAVIGGLLALVTFKLAAAVSQDERASLWATLLVMLSPPLFLYPYLVYPELCGALLTTVVLYYGLTQQKPAPGGLALVLFSLLALPWLNRRFIPLTIVLMLLSLWAWRKELRSFFSAGVLAFIVTAASLALLFWFNSQLSEPARTDITAPAAGSVLWRRLARGVGWLVDQQRGLFVYAPVYLLSIWGLPDLVYSTIQCVVRGRGAAQQPAPDQRAWFVIIPFFLSLGVTAAAGGFWIAWELGPRFLVVALPALAPLLALAWRHYSRYKVWQGLALVLFLVSLANGLSIVYQPELPYKSSLPLFYQQQFGLPVANLLPDLAEYAAISPAPSSAAQTGDIVEGVDRQGERVWLVEAGRSQPVINSEPLYELPYGHYQLTWPVQVGAELAPATELGRISVKLLGGGQVFNKIITGADVEDRGGGEHRPAFISQP